MPAADPDGGFSRAIDVVDLCVRQHFTCSLSHTPAQDRQLCRLNSDCVRGAVHTPVLDRHSCSLNSNCVWCTVRVSVRRQLLMQILTPEESSNVLNVIGEPLNCKGQTPTLYCDYLCCLHAIETKPGGGIIAMSCGCLRCRCSAKATYPLCVMAACVFLGAKCSLCSLP